MQTFKLVFLLSISLLFSCNDSTARSSNRGVVVDIRDYNGNKIFSYRGSYALIIGQSDYTAGWNDLNTISTELDEVESVLKEQGFVVERKSNLNSDQLQKAFENFIKKHGLGKEKQDNRLLFFYAGHGYTRDNGHKGYIVPVDAPDPHFDDTGFVQKALAMNQIVTWARNIESKHALFLFDSCFSGTVFKARGLSKLPRQIRRLVAKPVRQFITAGSADETVPASSTFTPAFVDALRYGKGDLFKDGYVTGEELGLYLKSIVSKYTRQTPQYGKINDYRLSRGDFVFKVGTKNQSETVVKSKVFQDPLRDGSLGPKMVIIPAGSFRMGDIQGGGDSDEKPVHRVSVGEFAMGMYEVTVGEFRKFVDSTGYRTDAEKEGSCHTYKNGSWNHHKGFNWRNPNFSQNNNHPVTCISWNDAIAYTKWLSNQTGKQYRLPTEAEWEYAARAGTETSRYWGNNPDLACSYANTTDQKAKEKFSNWTIHNCRDGYVYTAPSGSFKANKFGLYDMLGNILEWTCSKSTYSYDNQEKQCITNARVFVLRGGSWSSIPRGLHSAYRYGYEPTDRNVNFGFRLVRILTL